MLEFIRNRAKGIFAWIIIIVIIVPFGLWGIQQYTSGGSETPAAKVNDVPISQGQVQTTLYQQRQRLQEMLGPNYRADLFPEAEMKKRIVEELVERELLVQAASDDKMRVSNLQLAELIRTVPAFQADGKFSQEVYERALRSQGMTPAMFETELRRDLLVEQLRAGVMASEFVTTAEAREVARLRSQERRIGVIHFRADQLATGMAVSDAEVEAFYQRNKERFRVPEQVNLAYVELSLDGVAEKVQVSDADLRSYYDAHLDDYRQPEERRARHILFVVPPGDQKADAEAKQKATDLLAKIRAGGDFAKLAKEYSQDPGSASKGGDLDYFGRGRMDKPFEAAAFALKKGEVSEPVRSSYGYHLIKVEDVRGGGVRPFDAVKQEVAAAVKREKGEGLFDEQAEQLATLSYEHPDGLETAAGKLGLPINETGLFRRGAAHGLAANPKVMDAAFSDEVLVQGHNSEPIEVGRGSVVVVRVKEHQPARDRALDEVKNEIVADVRREKGHQAAQEAAEKALQAVRKGEAAEQVAAAQGAEWLPPISVRRDATTPEPAVVQQAFGLAKPIGDKPDAGRAAIPNGDQAVVVLYEVKEGSGELLASPMDRENLDRAHASAVIQGLINTLRKGADVKVYADKM